MELEYPFTITKKNTDAILKDISLKLRDTGYRYHFYLTEHKESCMLEVKFLEYGGICEENVPVKKFLIDKSSLGGKVLLTGEFKQCIVAGTHPKWQRFWRKQGLKRFLGVPLKIEGEVYGVLAVAKQEDIEFTVDEIKNVQRLAANLAVAMHTSKFIDTLRDMFDRNQSLMLGFTHEEALLNEICKNCREISQADKAFIFLVEQEDEQHQEYANNITVKKGLQKLLGLIGSRNKICANDIYADPNIRLNLVNSSFSGLQIKRAIEILRLIYVTKDSKKDFYTLNLKDVLKRLLSENGALTIKVKDGTKLEEKINIADFLFSDFAVLSVKGCADGLVDGDVIVKDQTNKEEYMYPYLILLREDFS
ncbi:MAG: GAF domain-containing protein, partial [Nitrospirota bacterium]